MMVEIKINSYFNIIIAFQGYVIHVTSEVLPRFTMSQILKIYRLIKLTNCSNYVKIYAPNLCD